MSLISLDLSGLKCPLPALKTRNALKRAVVGAQLEVRCTDPLAAIDIPNLVRETGDRIVRQDQMDRHLTFLIAKCQPTPER